jgi:putative SOS response-associated peptidase YedK
MCGRFTIALDAETFQQQLELGEMPPDWRSRYNVAPTQPIAVVLEAQTRPVEWLRWGLIPSWAKNIDIGSRLINARSETVMEKPSFRQAFTQRRCIILADGFYEWQHTEGKKGASTPYHFHLKNHRPFGFAGLWEVWQPPAGEPVRSCTILTTQANLLVAPIHDRMPVILEGADLWKWILPGKPEEHLSLLKPYPEQQMACYPVSQIVNSPGQDIVDCMLPITD